VTWDHSAYCDGVESEIAGFAAAIADADLTVPVPTCPDWTLGDLVLHTGEVHRWVTAMVADRTERPYRRSDLDHGAWRPCPAGWLRVQDRC
jgi:Mycothiol maleylpyruvate isomerase N-terminal domain